MSAASSGKRFTGTAEEGLAELRKVWGSKTDAKLAAANALVNAVAKHYPIKKFLRGSGLANHPGFIMKVAARARRRCRSAGE